MKELTDTLHNWFFGNIRQIRRKTSMMGSWFSLVADWCRSEIVLKRGSSQVFFFSFLFFFFIIFFFFGTAFIQNTSEKQHPTYIIFPLSSLNSTNCILNLVFWIKLHGGVGRMPTNGGGAKINTKSRQKILKKWSIFRKLCRSMGSWQRAQKTFLQKFLLNYESLLMGT